MGTRLPVRESLCRSLGSPPAQLCLKPNVRAPDFARTPRAYPRAFASTAAPHYEPALFGRRLVRLGTPRAKRAGWRCTCGDLAPTEVGSLLDHLFQALLDRRCRSRVRWRAVPMTALASPFDAYFTTGLGL